MQFYKFARAEQANKLHMLTQQHKQASGSMRSSPSCCMPCCCCLPRPMPSASTAPEMPCCLTPDRHSNTNLRSPQHRSAQQHYVMPTPWSARCKQWPAGQRTCVLVWCRSPQELSGEVLMVHSLDSLPLVRPELLNKEWVSIHLDALLPGHVDLVGCACC